MRVLTQLTSTLREAPRDVESAGQELLGLPLRAVVSTRSLKQGGVELKLRSSKDSRIVPLDEAVEVIREEIK